MVDQESKDSDKPRTTRVRKTGDTKYCGLIVPFKREPEKAKRTKGDYFCPICESSFTRREGVNYHFPSCVEKHGNPEGRRWNDHPSCSTGQAADEAPVAKKLRLETPTSGSANPSDNDRVAQSRALPLSGVVSRAPRVTRSHRKRRTVRPQSSSEQQIQPVQSTQPLQPVQAVQAVQPTKTKSEPRTRTKKASQKPVNPRRGKYQIDLSLRPFSNIDDIFNDMMSRALKIPAIAEAIQDLLGKWFHVATMCSGTESPLLALDRMNNGERRLRPLL